MITYCCLLSWNKLMHVSRLCEGHQTTHHCRCFLRRLLQRLLPLHSGLQCKYTKDD